MTISDYLLPNRFYEVQYQARRVKSAIWTPFWELLPWSPDDLAKGYIAKVQEQSPARISTFKVVADWKFHALQYLTINVTCPDPQARFSFVDLENTFNTVQDDYQFTTIAVKQISPELYAPAITPAFPATTPALTIPPATIVEEKKEFPWLPLLLGGAVLYFLSRPGKIIEIKEAIKGGR